MKFLFENIDKLLKLKEKSTVFVKQHVRGQVSPVSSQFGTLDSGCSNSKLCSLNAKGSRWDIELRGRHLPEQRPSSSSFLGPSLLFLFPGRE